MIERIKNLFPWYREMVKARDEAERYKKLFRRCKTNIRIEAAIDCDNGNLVGLGSAMKEHSDHSNSMPIERGAAIVRDCMKDAADTRERVTAAVALRDSQLYKSKSGGFHASYDATTGEIVWED